MSESSKKIIYILVGKDDLPLAGYSLYNGNFIESCVKFLKDVTKESSAQIRTESDYKMFYINENSITYLIMTTNDYPKETAIGCLESIKKEFQSSYPESDFFSEARFGLNNEFSPKLEMKFNYYNENPDCPDEIIKKLQDEVNNMKDVVINSLELLNERGGKMDIVAEKANNMAEDSEAFKVKAKNVRKSESKRKILIILGLILAVLVIAYAITCVVCGSMTFKCSS